MRHYIFSGGKLYDVDSNELYHWFGKGESAKNHKYIKREWKQGKWKYTYPSEDTDSSKTSNTKSAVKSHVIQKHIEVGRARLFNSRSNASDKSTNAKPSGTAKVSKEYLKEVLYNSQKNAYPGSKTVGDKNNTKQTANSNENKSTGTAKVSKEYLKETSYNSQKNVYPVTNKTTPSETTKSEPKKNWFDKSKQTLDEIAKYTTDKMKDVAGGIEKAKDATVDWVVDTKNAAVDWIEDTTTTLYNATVGEVKDRIGYDEKNELVSAQKRYDMYRKNVTRAIENLNMDIMLKRDSAEGITSESMDTNTFFMKMYYEDFSKAQADYTKAQAEYDSTLMGRVDKWLNGDDAITNVDEARAVAKAVNYNTYMRGKESDYVVNQLTLKAVSSYMDKHYVRDNDPIRKYADDLAEIGEEMRKDLAVSAGYGADLVDYKNERNLELERVDRILLDFNGVIDQRKR